MNVLLPSFTHCLAVISRCLAIVIILIKIFPIWHWPCVSLAWCLRLRSWRCLDWARSWGDCSVHYLMQPQWPLAPALPALSTCAWLRGPAAAQTRPKRQSSESLKINIYDGGYLSFYKRRGVAVVMQYIVATIIDPSQLLKFNTKVCQKCGSHF